MDAVSTVLWVEDFELNGRTLTDFALEHHATKLQLPRAMVASASTVWLVRPYVWVGSAEIWRIREEKVGIFRTVVLIRLLVVQNVRAIPQM